MIKAHIPEKTLVPFTIGTTAKPTITNTATETVSVRISDYTASSPTPIEVGTASGAAAGTDITVNLDLATANVVPGLWEVEAVSDRAGSNPKTLIPNETTGFPFLIEIEALHQI